MNNTIYYFTGTGNSLAVARKLAESIGSCNVKSIKDAINEELEERDIVGVVCPNYSYDVPYLVADFFKKLKHSGCYKYLFVTVTAGGDFGFISDKIQKRLKGSNLKSIFQYFMPFNFLPFGDVTSDEKQKELFSDLEKELKETVGVINNRESHIDNKVLPTSKNMKLLYSISYMFLPQFDRMFKVTEDCNGCDICQKVCPVGNIIMKNSKPMWNHNCQQCYACVHWCPKKSILCGKKSITQGRYHHPEVKLKDLVN